MMTLALGIPIGISEFLYFEQKLLYNWKYYTKKIKVEKDHPYYGIFCSFFRSQQEYPKHYFDNVPDEGTALIQKNFSMLTSEKLGT
jgi:hypothetical protein